MCTDLIKLDGSSTDYLERIRNFARETGFHSQAGKKKGFHCFVVKLQGSSGVVHAVVTSTSQAGKFSYKMR